nr:hypothetical protein [Tanacetum cinerariifolium]
MKGRQLLKGLVMTQKKLQLGSIPTASTPAEGSVPTGSEEVPTTSLVFATATVVTPVTRRKGKEVMVEFKTPKKQKVQEQIDAQVAKELEEQLEREDQRRAEQIARDAEITRIHAEEELQIMISSLDRNNETIAKYLQDPEVSKGNGNLNPTASTSNPPADQIETLTVETPIPTNVWTLVDCPKGVRPIGTKWVLKNKKDERGIVIRNKARLVAHRHTQEEGIDYDEVFSPVARIEAIILFLAYASFMGFIVYQMDVKSAFFYGTIDEEVLREPGMKEDVIFLSQDKYVGDILKKFEYTDVRSSNTLMDKENPWGKDKTRKDVDLHLYRSMIGSLMYLTASIPEIMFVVCACARHQVTPKECHLHAVKRIFRYLKGHPKLGLWYPKESPFNIVAYSDSNYGGTFKFWGVHRIRMISLTLIPLGEHNVDFHPMVDFIEASPLRYALTVKTTVYISHIRQFWSTASIETTEEGTKIHATVDGIVRTISEPSLRQYTRRAKIAQSSALPTVADEPASP